MQAVERYLAVRAGLDARERDPLRYWHHASPQSIEATRLVNEFDEVYARAANKAGKTEWAGALTLALLQKRRELDGIELPSWRGPVSALALSLDYNQQKLSVQQTILRLLGKWPHHAKWKGDDVLSSLRVKPAGGSDDESTWSILTFMSQENKRTGVGARADIVWADEPPVEEIWRELRKAAHAGRRVVRLISATPIFRRQWAWLKADYGDCPRGQIKRHEDFAEVRWSLDDNRILTALEIAKLKRFFQKQPAIFDARVYGDYIDTSGSCPFDVETLLKLLNNCREPEVVDWRITRETHTDEGLVRAVTTVPVEVYTKPKYGASYYIPIDPSSGVNDPRHDPGGLHVREIGSGDLAARFNGYLGSYGLGVLGAGLARQYNNATVDPEVTGGWGEGVLRGLNDSHYGHIAKERSILDDRGKFTHRAGFTTTFQTRSAMIAQVQSWIDAWRSGVKYATCQSRAVIQCLLDTILDEDDKAVAAPGFHDEDLILWGQGLRRAVPHVGRMIPEFNRPTRTADEEIAALIAGEAVEPPMAMPSALNGMAQPRRRPKLNY